MCDRRQHLRSIPSEVGITINPYGRLTYVKGFGKMVQAMCTDDQKRTRLDISRYLLSGYEDVSGNFI